MLPTKLVLKPSMVHRISIKVDSLQVNEYTRRTFEISNEVSIAHWSELILITYNTNNLLFVAMNEKIMVKKP